MRQGDVVYFLHSDHLGSTSLTTDITGTVVAQTRYLPYGEERWITGTVVTDFTFTGQRAEAGFRLMDYNARYYDPWLGRFISADTVVPEPGNPQALNRYSYVLNRPLQGGDPTGHQGPWSDVLPPRTQPIDPVTLEQMAEALKQGVQSAGPYAPVVAGTAMIAAAAYVDIRYGGPMVADWAMQDMGPAYPLPDVTTPQSPNVQPTWVLPGTSTLTSQSQDVLRPQPPTSREDSTRGAGAHLLARKRLHTPPREAYPGQLGGKYQPDSPKQQGPPGKPTEIGAPPPGPWYERIAETIRDPNVPAHEKILLAVYGAVRTILAPLIGGPPDHP
jgi:RHS repeat-associated protein